MTISRSPFLPKELVLRVNNVIKRVYKDDNNRIHGGRL